MVKPRITNLTPKIVDTQNVVKELQQKILSQTRETLGDQNVSESFLKNLSEAIQNVSDHQHQKRSIKQKF